MRVSFVGKVLHAPEVVALHALDRDSGEQRVTACRRDIERKLAHNSDEGFDLRHARIMPLAPAGKAPVALAGPRSYGAGIGFNVGEWTVRVLEQGLPDLPERLEPSQTVPLALWRGEHHGAVLFVRLWRNGQFDSDLAVTRRAADGSWEHPNGWGGGGWIDDPLVRPDEGWDGEPALWLGTGGTEDCVAVEGVAATTVAAIEVEQDGRRWQVPIDSPSGAFVVGVEDPREPVLRAVDEAGRALEAESFTAVFPEWEPFPEREFDNRTDVDHRIEVVTRRITTEGEEQGAS